MNVKLKLSALCVCAFVALSMGTVSSAAVLKGADNAGAGDGAGVRNVGTIAAEKQTGPDEMKARMEEGRRRGLEERAKEEGISVEELKARFKAERAEMDKKLEEIAKSKGITVEQLKSRIAEEHEKSLEGIAKENGISVNELKMILRDIRHEAQKK